MNILLGAVNAKYIHSNLAVYSLRAYAGAYDEHIQLGEYTINQQEDEILKDIYERKPDGIFFSCYIWNISLIREMIRDIHKILPTAFIWVGGPEVSFDAEKFLQENPSVTGVMVGEGEAVFLELMEMYVDQKHRLEEIMGIVFRDENGEIHRNAPRPCLDLSSVPFVYKSLEDFAHRIIYYESSRGCPFSCSYCLSSIDKKLRFRNMELVKEELQFFIDQKVPQVKFVDRTFNCSHSHAMEIWSYLAEHDNGVTNFHFEVAADLLNKEEIRLIQTMRPGLIQLEIGVQSTNPDTVREIKRTMDFTKVSHTVKCIREGRNIHQHLDLIAGLPYENLESFRKSFNQVYALRPDQLQLGFLKVLKGSYMYEMAESYGCIYKEKEPYEVLSTKWLSYEDILLLKRVEQMVEVYYNSGQFVSTLIEIEHLFENAFAMYEQLGAFYEERGYGAVSHSRIRRYDILLEFLEMIPGIDMSKIRDCLTYDLYIRENLKSRPDWMKDQKPYQRQVREYFREHQLPKTSHVEVFEDNRVMIFDYTDRDPLTNNAAAREITL